MVEFALIGPPFLLCLVFVIELGYDLYAQEMLDYGLHAASRQIQLGAAQGETTPANFKNDYLCGTGIAGNPPPPLNGFLTCANIFVNVITLTTKTTDVNAATIDWTKTYYGLAAAEVLTMTGGTLDTNAFTYCPGGPGLLMLATAVYTSPSIVWHFIPSMALLSGGGQVHATMSATSFVNENFAPMSGTPPGCASAGT